MVIKRKGAALFLIGCLGYPLIELLWRGRTHWSMSLLGGFCCAAVGSFCGRFRHISLLKRCVCGSAIITAAEFCSGAILNLRLKRNIWDYSRLRFNFKGQICVLYSILWGLLCIPVNAVSYALCKTKTADSVI